VPILVAQNLQKTFGNQIVLEDVSISIHTGERVGLVGINGSGKSTLARLLAQIEAPDVGSVARRRDARVLYLDQNPTFEGNPTAHDAVRSGLGAWDEAMTRYESVSHAIEQGEGDLDSLLTQQADAGADVERLGGWERGHQVDSILGHLGVEDTTARVDSMSGGERRRVALGRLLIARPEMAILDEPTNHLDVETIDWLERYLVEDYEGALLLITHDRYLLDRVATRTVEMNRGKAYFYEGGYEAYLEAKAERQAIEARTESNRQNFLRTELEWLRRQPKARSTKQKARIDRAEEAKSIRAPRADKQAALAIETTRSGKTILELRGLVLGAGDLTLSKPFDLILTAGERVGIVGRNGTGKTTLLKVITGALAPVAGSVIVGQNTKIAYFDQHRSGLDDSKSIFDNVVGDQPKIEVGGVAIEPRSYLERFLFDPHKQRQQVGSLSGGERARVALARMLRQSANLVLFDEPTNDLDVAMLGSLEQMLIEFGGTALVVTHDRWFLDRVATAILAFEGEGRVVRYAGNHDTYRRLRAEAEEREAQARKLQPSAAAEPRPAATKVVERGRAPKLSHAETQELASIVEAIDLADTRVSQLEGRLADPAVYSAGGDEVKNLTTDLTAARAEAARLMARWEELEARRTAASH
jgi:ATP-binding cassette subfamily F protein uup